MVTGLLVTGAILCVVVFIVVLFFQRGSEGVDLSARSLMRLYLYVASLAGMILVVVGLSALLTYGFAGAYGNDFAYGRAPIETLCPPGAPAAPGCLPAAEQQRRESLQQERRRGEGLLSGLTFLTFGVLVWGAHRAGRRFAAVPDEEASVLGRGYHIIGTGIFGLVCVVALPTGIYQALSSVLLAAPPEVYRGAAGEPLAGGIVALPLWLGYLWRAARDFRRSRAAPPRGVTSGRPPLPA